MFEPEVIAGHWVQSEQPENSIPFWVAAGQSALRRSAYLEAIRNCNEGLEIYRRMDIANASPDGFQLALCFAQASYVINGPASSETTTAYSRALGLVDEFGTQDQRFEILYGLFSGYHFASKFNQAREPAEKALELSRLLNDPGYSCQAHRMLGYLSFF